MAEVDWRKYITVAEPNTPGKVCITCKWFLTLDSFHKNKKNADGLQARCKRCIREYHLANKKKLMDADRRRNEKSRKKLMGLTGHKRKSKKRVEKWVEGGDYGEFESASRQRARARIHRWLSGESNYKETQ